jgi:hypothetical protein
MMKYPRVSTQLLALSELRRAKRREAGAPLHAPSPEYPPIETTGRREAGADGPVEAGGLTIGADEDDDFY